MISNLTKPSYSQGFARRGETAYPNLWRGLVGAWIPSLGPTGNTLFDVSGFRNHGTLTNMEPATDWVIGGNSRLPGYALNFDGTNEHVNVGDVAILDGAIQAAFSFWFKKTGDGDPNNRFISKDNAYELSVREASVNSYTVRINNVGLTFSGTAPVDNVWTHIVMMYHDSVTNGSKLYINGAFESAGTLSRGGIDNTATSLSFGGRGVSHSYNGQIDNIFIYNRGLIPTEIKFLYENPMAPFQLRQRVFKSPVVETISIDKWYQEMQKPYIEIPQVVAY